jgi:putative ABC transport system permease protein
VERIPHVTFTAPRLEAFALASAGTVTDGAQVIGIDPAKEDRLTGLKKKVTKGRYLTRDDKGIMLAEGLAQHLGLDVGDTVIVLGSGYHGISAAGRFRIIGTVRYATPDLNTTMSYLALPEAQWFYGAPDRATSLAVMLDSPKDMESVDSTLPAALGPRYEVISWKTMMPELVEYIQVDNASGIIMLILIYVVVGFGILGTVLMMTMERTREFGVMVAVGMQRAVIRRMILLESIILALIGAVAGMLSVIPLLWWFKAHPIYLGGEMADAIRSYGFEPILPFSLAPSIFFWQTVTVLIIAVIAAGYPLLRVSHLDPVRAIQRGH